MLHSNRPPSTYSAAAARSRGTSEDVIMWAGSPTWVGVSPRPRGPPCFCSLCTAVMMVMMMMLWKHTSLCGCSNTEVRYLHWNKLEESQITITHVNLMVSCHWLDVINYCYSGSVLEYKLEVLVLQDFHYISKILTLEVCSVSSHYHSLYWDHWSQSVVKLKDFHSAGLIIQTVLDD